MFFLFYFAFLTLKDIKSVAYLAVEFQTLAMESGWNQEALTVAFNEALYDEIKDDPATDL